jgi:hypothetical protein
VAPGKTRITIRLDEDILRWFKAQVHAAGGGNYQALINAALREHIDRTREPLDVTLRRVIREEAAHGMIGRETQQGAKASLRSLPTERPKRKTSPCPVFPRLTRSAIVVFREEATRWKSWHGSSCVVGFRFGKRAGGFGFPRSFGGWRFGSVGGRWMRARAWERRRRSSG